MLIVIDPSSDWSVEGSRSLSGFCCVSGFFPPDLVVDANGGALTVQAQLDWWQDTPRGGLPGSAGIQERRDLLPELSCR